MFDVKDAKIIISHRHSLFVKQFTKRRKVINSQNSPFLGPPV